MEFLRKLFGYIFGDLFDTESSLSVPAELRAPDPIPALAAVDTRRPCWARGRKALFHSWASVAHPVPPRGVELTDKARFFQFRRLDALVEFEDGTVSRVYESEIQFADGGAFEKFTWLPMTEGGQDDGTA